MDGAAEPVYGNGMEIQEWGVWEWDGDTGMGGGGIGIVYISYDLPWVMKGKRRV